jgi:hypothetical protein
MVNGDVDAGVRGPIERAVAQARARRPRAVRHGGNIDGDGGVRCVLERGNGAQDDTQHCACERTPFLTMNSL